ncbi:hypothetical protein [Streptomyces sp. CCM_MD2014]|uniref:hypothetical protein n=1 Tax=Streptomyces sp. CCM_MD2014 TaxID=1561022 RepID=UPI00052AFF84|nr:hypothetical protein [Streptomyces sp. CCM_MD2014]AIV35571.1 hypothetical protein NI25_20415 [Streptomyces sp. CCM_MD2014]
MGYRSDWQDGRRAWQRLNGWHNRNPTHPVQRRDDGESALAALKDIHRVRSLLDLAEQNAIITARREGISWAEISTTLHIPRAELEARWADLDTDR